jgi:hypothetical protein
LWTCGWARVCRWDLIGALAVCGRRAWAAGEFWTYDDGALAERLPWETEPLAPCLGEALMVLALVGWMTSTGAADPPREVGEG